METPILKRLDQLEELITSQSISQKGVLNFKEACEFLDLKPSTLYHFTSQRKIPFYNPGGKKLYFDRAELESWMTSRRNASVEDSDSQADNYLSGNGFRNKKRS